MEGTEGTVTAVAASHLPEGRTPRSTTTRWAGARIHRQSVWQGIVAS